MPTSPPSARGRLGGDIAAAVPNVPPSARSLSAITWGMVAKTQGFGLLRHNVFFSGDYAAEFDDIFRRGKLPAEPTVYVCAQDRDDQERAEADSVGGPEALLCLVNAPATGDTRGSRSIGDRAMRGADISAAGALRLAHHAAGRDHGEDHAEGFRATLSRDGRRAVRAGVARMDGLVPPLGGAQPNAGPLSRGRQHASGTGSSDGGDFGPVGGGSGPRRLRFDEHVPSGGYAWWYVDALSDDGQHGLTIIAFIGSVFSPYYAWARAHGEGDPLNHCALNVALYGRDRKRWAMTERGRGHVGRASSSLAIGPSLLTWDGDALTIRIDEVTAPAPSRIRGVVRVYPKALTSRAFALDPADRHRWWPIAPSAHVEVTLEQPALRWSGDGYLDSNTGEAPLEAAFPIVELVAHQPRPHHRRALRRRAP